jgi:uncharacterized protein (DUF2235 family)
MKNIIVCCDGTNNQFSGCHTNVIRAFKVTERLHGQTSYYDPGVGTNPLAGWVTKVGEWWSIIKGLAFGAGLLADIDEAYRYLMRVYEPGDRVYLFGFSRGAFTVRALAGMLNAVGLLYPDSEQLVPYARKYWRQYKGPGSDGDKVCIEFKATLARPCPVHFIGVWDTVSSVGLKNIMLHISNFPFTSENPSVTHVRHAVSVDERRCFFRQNLMLKCDPHQDIKNVWFAGVHSDVGGGYPLTECGLSKVAFEWLMAEAKICGLKIDMSAGQDGYPYELGYGQPPDPRAMLHDSLTAGWMIAEIIPTRHYSFSDKKRHWGVNLGRPRDILGSRDIPGVAIHQSVLDRMDKVPTYRPPNLPGSSAAVGSTYTIEPWVRMSLAAGGTGT